MRSVGVPMSVRMGPASRLPNTETTRPPTSAMVIAVWTEARRRSSSRAPKYWLHTTAKPVPMPTEKPTARSTSGAVAWIPPSAALPAN